MQLEYLTWSTLIVLLIELQFIVKESYTQAPHYFPIIAFHIEITPIADGTYKLIQEPDGDISEAQANVVELTEVPNSDSEESKPTDLIDCWRSLSTHFVIQLGEVLVNSSG